MTLHRDLDYPLVLNREQIEHYRTNNYLKVKDALSAKTIEYYNEVISEEAAQINKESRPIDERDTYGKAFLQMFNFWRKN